MTPDQTACWGHAARTEGARADPYPKPPRAVTQGPAVSPAETPRSCSQEDAHPSPVLGLVRDSECPPGMTSVAFPRASSLDVNVTSNTE